MNNRYFVAIGTDGRPVTQRVSVRAGAQYLSASRDGCSFSSLPPSARHPLRVIQVQKAVEWIARATLPDGSKETKRSKAGPPGCNFLRYSYLRNAHTTSERVSRDCWTSESEAEVRESHRSDSALAYEIIAFAPGAVETRHWPPEPPDMKAAGFSCDLTRGGHERWTHFQKDITCLRQPHMNDKEWEQAQRTAIAKSQK